ncbi:MAG: Multidrug resistance efflux pump [Rhodobacteraceae bacterium HLUCCO07]|nr:MAG: Multidrug resistance efflux pump [Rhodobacteraceae bacterium HLUCCO07]
MRFLRQSLTGLFLLSLALGGLFYAGYTLQQAIEARMAREARVPQESEREFAVRVVRAETGEIAPVLTSYGEIKSSRTLDIRASVGGRVIELSDDFVEGGRVKEGALLLRLDPADAQDERDRAASDLEDAEAEARDAARALDLARDDRAAAEEQVVLQERALRRQLNLRERGVGSDAAVESAELAASAARATVISRRQAIAQAEARLDNAQTRKVRARIALGEAERRLADMELRAGFSGMLSGVTLVEGGLVSANTLLAELIDESALEVAFRVSTRDYVRLLEEDGRLRRAPVRAVLDVFGMDVTAQGQLVRDSASVGEGQTGRLLFARLDEARGFKPGDFVTVEIKEPPLDGVIVLPAGALGSAGDVLALDSDERLERVEVELLRRQGDEIVIRAENLAGRDVVADRTPLLGPGIKVRPLRTGPTEAATEPEMLELSEERRARLVAFIEGNRQMPESVKSRILAELAQSKVPAETVSRIEARMGG